MLNKLRVKAIQYYPEKLDSILDSLNDGFNIVYSNLKSSINLNGIKLKSRKFDTMLYNEEDNLIILLMRGGTLFKEDIINYLDIYEKPYAEVTFEKNPYEYQDGDDIPELCFVNNKKDLSDELIECVLSNINDCKYYISLKGTMDLGYMDRFDNRVTLDKKRYKGVLKFENKLIFLSPNDNLTQDSILNILKKYMINYDIDKDKQPDLYVNNFTEKVKSLKLRNK